MIALKANGKVGGDPRKFLRKFPAGLLAWPAIFSSPFRPAKDTHRQIGSASTPSAREALRRFASPQATSNGAALAGDV